MPQYIYCDSHDKHLMIIMIEKKAILNRDILLEESDLIFAKHEDIFMANMW